MSFVSELKIDTEAHLEAEIALLALTPAILPVKV